jgi:hypothetical protein
MSINWSDPQPIDSRSVDLTDPPDWRVIRMSEADVDVLETELHMRVPEFLREWFVKNPFRDSANQRRAIVCHRDRLIYENVELRRAGFYGRKWPEQLLWVGDDWAGGAYFVDVTESSPAVYWYDWEEGRGDAVLTTSSERWSAEEFIRFVEQLDD